MRQSKTDPDLYERDLAIWAQGQASAIREGRWMGVDVANLVEEIEDIGKSQHNELESRLSVLLMHLMKVELQPERDENPSWWSTVIEQQRRIRRLLAKSPSLRPQIAGVVGEEYPSVRKRVALEANVALESIPVRLPPRVERNLAIALEGGDFEGLADVLNMNIVRTRTHGTAH
ncbi:MAG TPA: DUF29 domain-containing protein [Candidatus Dormibacteraeota bacterium]|nr:DUF29 domain-containing protein [Candidatus Dormibacteraeota bacterium]